jgi:signal transduction histidine kinase
MVSAAHSSLTKLGFRRDVRLFISVLVGFFIILILVLLVLLQFTVSQVEETSWETFNLSADRAARDLRDLHDPFDRDAVGEQLNALMRRYDLAGVSVRWADGSSRIAGYRGPGTDTIERAIPGARVMFYVNAASLHVLKRRLVYTSIITLVACSLGTILLIFYVRTILRPVEEMLDHARELDGGPAGDDETTYLIETFRTSIARLREQEGELKRLHEVEKARADELQILTATLTRNLTSGFIAIGPDGRIVDANVAAREILAMPVDKTLAGFPLVEALGATRFAEVVAWALEAHRSVSREEVEIEDPDGTRKTVGITTVPLFSDEGRFLGMLVLFTDLTRIRDLESRLRETQRLAELGEISAGIAHEFRNALSTILGYLKLARRGPLPQEVETRIVRAEAEAIELSRTVDGLLGFAKPVQLVVSTLDVAQLAKDIATRLVAESNGTVVEFSGGPLEIEGDASLLGRVIENIIRNSLDSIQQKGVAGRIDISTRVSPRPTLMVRDNGVGIDPAIATRMFLPFQTTKTSGAGLGLALARKIVVLHGGDIRVTGEPGEGATVTIEFAATFEAELTTKVLQ